jgi:hypothetical protein
MSIITRNLRQKVTYWSSVPDGFGGYTFTVPHIANSRWEEKAVLFRAPDGEEQTSSAVVYLDIGLEVGDYLYLGESALASPVGLAETHQIRQFYKTPDLRNHEVENKAML